MSISPTLAHGNRLLDIDEHAFAACFSQRSLAVRHQLADHPLLTLD